MTWLKSFLVCVTVWWHCSFSLGSVFSVFCNYSWMFIIIGIYDLVYVLYLHVMLVILQILFTVDFAFYFFLLSWHWFIFNVNLCLQFLHQLCMFVDFYLDIRSLFFYFFFFIKLESVVFCGLYAFLPATYIPVYYTIIVHLCSVNL